MVTGGGDEIKLKISGVLHAMFYNTSGALLTRCKWRTQAEESWVCSFGSQVEMKCVDPDVVETLTWCDCVFRYCRPMLCVTSRSGCVE